MNATFSIDVREEKNVNIFTTHGYINNIAGEMIASKYEEESKKGAKKFLFNLADTKLVNSIGVSILIEILEKTLNENGVMAFCNCVPIIAKTLNIMGLVQYAKIYETVEEGLKDMG